MVKRFIASSKPDTGPRQRAAPAAANGAWLALDRQLCFALYSASLAMTKHYKPLLEPLSLTYPQYLAMLVLWEGDGITVSELGQRLMLDSGTLTPLLKRLEASGLLKRERDRHDERRVLLKLSPTGRALKARALPVSKSIARSTGCTLRELADLTLRIQQLRDEVHAIDGRSTPEDSSRGAAA